MCHPFDLINIALKVFAGLTEGGDGELDANTFTRAFASGAIENSPVSHPLYPWAPSFQPCHILAERQGEGGARDLQGRAALLPQAQERNPCEEGQHHQVCAIQEISRALQGEPMPCTGDCEYPCLHPPQRAPVCTLVVCHALLCPHTHAPGRSTGTHLA